MKHQQKHSITKLKNSKTIDTTDPEILSFFLANFCTLFDTTLHFADLSCLSETDIALQTNHVVILGPGFNTSNVYLIHKESKFYAAVEIIEDTYCGITKLYTDMLHIQIYELFVNLLKNKEKQEEALRNIKILFFSL